MSRATYPDGAELAYVATAGTFPDALSGGPAAAIRRAPVLLVNPSGVPEETAEELRRLGLARIAILGGTASVSKAVEEELAAIAPTVRHSGASRYDTAAAVSRDAFAAGASRVYIASGEGFVDALAAATVAGAERVPLLLTSAGALPAATAGELDRLNPEEIVVVGDAQAVGESVEQELEAYAAVVRIAGDSPYGTPVTLSRARHESASHVYVATVESFADALAGGAAAAVQGAPLLFVGRDVLPGVVADELGRLGPSSIVVLGGPGAVSDQVLAELERYAG